MKTYIKPKNNLVYVMQVLLSLIWCIVQGVTFLVALYIANAYGQVIWLVVGLLFYIMFKGGRA